MKYGKTGYQDRRGTPKGRSPSPHAPQRSAPDTLHMDLHMDKPSRRAERKRQKERAAVQKKQEERRQKELQKRQKKAALLRQNAQKHSMEKELEREDRLSEIRRQKAYDEERLRERLIRENSSKKQKRKKHRKNYALYYILIFLILLITSASLSMTVFFNITDIRVVGNADIPASDIIAAANVKTGDNLFRFSTRQAEKKILDKYLSLDDVSVQRKLPSTLLIRVLPAKIKAVILDKNRYYTVSARERVIAVSDEDTDKLSLHAVGCALSSPKIGDRLSPNTSNKLDVLNTLTAAIRQNGMTNDIQCADVSNVLPLKIYYHNRIEIKLDGNSDICYELAHVKQLIAKNVSKEEIVSIDASLENGRYYIRPLDSLTLPTSKTKTAATTSSALLTPSEQ